MCVSESKFDVTLTIDSQEFYCQKQSLAQHSTYFHSMFFSNFAEKNKKNVVIKGVRSEDFQLFLDAISGVNSISDENIENALALSAFLGSPELEKECMNHLADGSKIPLKEQFQLAEVHVSENLMIQVCSSIKDAYELDEVVPKDLDSFCNTTKNIVLQRSFELLGIRKAPLPPQSEDLGIVFEGMIGELLDQADVQNDHGMILADQALLLRDYLNSEEILDRHLPEAKPLIQEDPRIHELMGELQNAHSPAERNAVRAQIHVVKVKNIYRTLIARGEPEDHPTVESIPSILEGLYRIVHRNQRDHSKHDPSAQGELLIDLMYRRIIEEMKERLALEATFEFNRIEPLFVTMIKESVESLPWRAEIQQNLRLEIFDSCRRVSGSARFHGLEHFVQNAREWSLVNLFHKSLENQNQNQAE